jgi:hypothetical protein
MTQHDHDLAAIAASHREPRKVPGPPQTSRTLVVIAAVGLALLATGCGGSPDAPTPGAKSARVDQAMTYIRQHNQDIASEAGNQGESRPAMPYLLVGARDSKGYRAYVSSEAGVQQPTSGVANVGSSTKSFTAALIVQLDQEGTLSLDDTLADPRWNNVSSGRTDRTSRSGWCWRTRRGSRTTKTRRHLAHTGSILIGIRRLRM